MDIALFGLAVLLFGLGLYIIFRICDISAQCAQEEAEIRKWWADRAQYRADNPPELSDSPLVDDVNRALPDEFKDGGDRAA